MIITGSGKILGNNFKCQVRPSNFAIVLSLSVVYFFFKGESAQKLFKSLREKYLTLTKVQEKYEKSGAITTSRNVWSLETLIDD